MYTVKQWIHMLKELPQDAVVIVSSDPEGNSYSPLSNGIANAYWNIQINELIDEDEEDFEELLPEEKIKAVVLFPEH
jgi:hypothetical protein